MNGRTAALALSVAVVAAGAVGAQVLPAERTHAAVFIHVTTIDDINGIALNALREEATRIWARHRVSVTWGREEPPLSAGYQAVVLLVFDHRRVSKYPEAEHDVLARTVFLGRTQTIYVSMQRARRMLRAFRGSISGIEADPVQQIRAGVLVGRVVAHEIGHVLLTSLQHSDEGLMRAIFSLRDVISGEDALTALATHQSEKLAMRFSLSALVPAAVVAQRPSAR